MEWSHTLLGQYNIEADSLAVDLARNFMDPIQAQLVHVHEVTHANLSRTTDIGLASIPIHASIQRFDHLTEDDKKKLMTILHRPQILPQEGFATLMEVLHLKSRVGKAKALQYAKDKFPKDYYARFEELDYCLDMSHRYREKFTGGISWLAMETGFREDAPKLDLLRSPDALEKYMSDPDNNPTDRLRKLNELLKGKPYMVTKPVDQIAHAAGITIHEPASKQTVADYMNYIAELAGSKQLFTAEMVNESPGENATKEAFENARVTNINHNFTDDAEFLSSIEDIEWEADASHCVMIISWPEYGEREKILEEATGLKPDFGFVFFRRTGEKYIAFLSKEKAIELVEGKLADKTIISKDDMYVISTGEFLLSKIRMPDIIYYDHPKTLKYRINEADTEINTAKHLNMGTSKDHPYRIIAYQLNQFRPLHIANAFGDAHIVDIQNKLGTRDERIDFEVIRNEYKDEINDYLGVMGLPWEIDWVTTMIDQKELARR